MASNPQLKLMTDLLKLEGVYVVKYQMIEEMGIVMYLENIEQKATCIYCGSKTGKIHQNNQLTIRDLPFGEQPIYLRINRRQMRCNKCGKKFTEELNYVKKKRTYTERFKQKIIGEVLNSDIKNVAKRNGVSEQEIETMLKDIAVEFKQDKPINLKRLGIDEIAVVKGQGNYYVVLVDIDKGIIIGIIEKRTEIEVEKYLEAWGKDILSGVEEVSIDLWNAYKNVAKKLMPQAEIVADRFHIMKQVNDELDRERKVIKREAERSKKSQERSKILAGIKNSKYALLKNESDLKEAQKEKLKELKEMCPKLEKMHQLKEEFRNLFETSENWSEGLLNLAVWLVEASQYFPKSCGTIRRWIGEIIAYFDQRTTQGVVEGINNKLKLIKRRGYGFRNFHNFQLRSFLTWHFTA